MMVRERITQLLRSEAERTTLKAVFAGLLYTAVEIENGGLGVAFTFHGQTRCTPSDLRLPQPLAGRCASEILPALTGNFLAYSSIAMAAVNAIISTSYFREDSYKGDILDFLDLKPRDKVCMVGCFLPIMSALDGKDIEITAFDEIPKPGTSPLDEMKEVLPKSDVAIITSTSIINGTIDSLLQLAESCREIALLGPSTPLFAEAFIDTPVTLLSGIKVTDRLEVKRIIGEGGGFREFKHYVEKLNIRLKYI